MDMTAKELKLKPFTLFDEDWALLTAGKVDNHNSMTISWGEIGTLWHYDVVTVYVKPLRYTHDFMERNDLFVVSFFDESFRKALSLMGSKSGRDINKDKESHLTPTSYKGTTIYKEAKLSLICKKIYQNDLVLENMPEEEKRRYYEKEAPHTMYIGEILEVIEQ